MIITLTSDMGLKDYYVASLKGSILKELTNVTIIDISHDIPPFDISNAAFVIKNCFNDFPKGTIHIISIVPEQNSESKHVIISYNDQYFIGADNGIFSLIFDKIPDGIWQITLNEDSEDYSFPTKNIFIKAACHLARGGVPSVIGLPLESINTRQLFRAIADTDSIKGTIRYIDSYGNLITNISKDLFYKVEKQRKFKVFLSLSQYTISKIYRKYGDVPDGEVLALFSSSGFLEIAINKGVDGSGGGANQLFGLKINDTISIDFY